MSGKVYITGAGCGDIELITLKALNILKHAQVLLYDNLINKALLEYAPKDCEKIATGKRYNGKSMPQEEINGIMIAKAREGKLVVRLKGGDPYIFGRGGEEMSTLIQSGISCEEIPGITSAIAAPAYSGIPLTYRNLSRSVTILTASSYSDETGKEELTQFDYSALVKLNGTLVFLMGIHHLETITTNLINAGMAPCTPAAVIMNGTLPEQKTVKAELSTIVQAVRDNNISSPAVIVIGKTAGMSLNTKKGSLNGLKVGITGTKSFYEKLGLKLSLRSADVRDYSFLNIEPVYYKLPNLNEYSYIVFTSPNGVKSFFDKMFFEKKDFREIFNLKFAVIGSGTADKLASYGFYPDLIPEIFDSYNLAKLLVQKVSKSERILICRSDKANPTLAEELERAGIKYLDFCIYKLEQYFNKKEKINNTFIDVDYICFGSAYGVNSFFEDRQDIASIENTKIVCIGEKCAEACFNYGLKNILVAKEYTIDGIVKCIEMDAL